MESLNKTDRENLISIILDYGYGNIYKKSELKTFTNKKLAQVLYRLFEELEIQKRCLEKKNLVKN